MVASWGLKTFFDTCRWETVTCGFTEVIRNLVRTGDHSDCLATYRIEKDWSVFHQMVITVHRELKPVLLHVMLFWAASHVCKKWLYYSSPEHSSQFEH